MTHQSHQVFVPALLGLALAACAPQPHEVPPPKGPPLVGSSTDWHSEFERMHELPSKSEVEGFSAAVRAACPSAPDGGPSPALSPGARDFAMEQRRYACRYISLSSLVHEMRTLLEFARHTRKDDPDYSRIWQRIAKAAFVFEYHEHRDCENLASARPDERGRLEALREQLRKLTREIALARGVAAQACDELARIPGSTPKVACPHFAPPALAPTPPACMDALASRNEPALALTCGP